VNQPTSYQQTKEQLC